MSDDLERQLAASSPVRRNWYPPDLAAKQVARFASRYGSHYLDLACHAALPSLLTPELLNLIRINFLDQHNIPYQAEADFLLSPLCQEIDEGLYEIEPAVREVLLAKLEERFGPAQVRRVAEFLQYYLVKKPDWLHRQDVARAHQWIARAYLDPQGLIQDIYDRLAKSVDAEGRPIRDLAAQVQMVTLVELVAGQLERQSVAVENRREVINFSRLLERLLYDPDGHHRQNIMEQLRRSASESAERDQTGPFSPIMLHWFVQQSAPAPSAEESQPSARPAGYETRLREFMEIHLGLSGRPALFGGRKKELDRLNAWLDTARETGYGSLVAHAGRGKSALLAHWAVELQRKKDVGVVLVSAGQPQAALNEEGFFRLLAEGLTRFYGEAPLPETTPLDGLRRVCNFILSRMTPTNRRMVVILDGIEQLQGWNFNLEEFPKTLPAHVRVLISTRIRPAGMSGRGFLINWGGNIQVRSFELPLLKPLEIQEVLAAAGHPRSSAAKTLQLIALDVYSMTEGEPEEVNRLASSEDPSGMELLWPDWQRRIESVLFRKGNAGANDLGDIPASYRQYALQRYFSENQARFDLKKTGGGIALKNNASHMRSWSSAWKRAGAVLDTKSGITDAVLPSIQQMADTLEALTGLEFQDFLLDETVFAHRVINKSLALHIPSRFPVLFVYDPNPSDRTGQKMVEVAEKLQEGSNYFALVIALEPTHPKQNTAEALRRLVERLPLGRSLIVLGRTDLLEVVAAPHPGHSLARFILSRTDLNYISPFVINGPVTSTMAFGRDTETRKLVEQARHKDFAVIGNRRLGKTSLLNIVYNRLQAQGLTTPIRIDCQAMRTPASFYHELQAISGLTLAEESPTGMMLAFREYARDHSLPVLLIDEVDALLSNTFEEVERFWASCRTLAMEGVCHIIMFGTAGLLNAVGNPKSAAYSFLQPMILGYLGRDQAELLLTNPLKELGISLAAQPEMLETAWSLTSGHPNLVQYIGNQLVKAANERHDRVVTPDDLTRLRESLEFIDFYFSVVWGACGPLEKLITLVAPGEGFAVTEIEERLRNESIPISVEALDKALEFLTAFSILSRAGQAYTFIPSAFPELLRQTQDVDQLIRIERYKLGHEEKFAPKKPAARPEPISKRKGPARFSYRGPLLPDSPMFFDRETELARLIELCTGPIRSYAMVMGSRQAGKTSLLYRLAANLPPGIISCSVDLQLRPEVSSREVFTYMASRLSEALGSKEEVEASTSSELIRTISKLLKDRSETVVLLIDEIGALPEPVRLDLANVLRAIYTSRYMRVASGLERLMVILFGGIELLTLEIVDVSPLSNVCEIFYLFDLPQEDAEELIRFGLAETGVPHEQAQMLAHSVYLQVHGQPGLTQHLGGILADIFRERGAVEPGDVEQAAVNLLIGSSLINSIVQRVKSQSLEEAARRLILGDHVRFTRLDNELSRLELLGVIRAENGQAVMRNALVERALREALGIPTAPGEDIQSQEALKRLPNAVSLLELQGVRRVEELRVWDTWQQNLSARSLAVPVGIGENGQPVLLDLHASTHGPHGLVAGTTGSGKSEFLQTLVLSLASHYHPHEVAIAIIDFKGGGLAKPLAELPHVIGWLGNPNEGSFNRILVSLQAERERRAALFTEVGVTEIEQYQALARQGLASKPLPHLIIIVDEFAEMAYVWPEFMADLLTVARVGRSLGLHLILATQRPAGVVSAEIRSNIHFRICFRVEVPEDSQEILHDPIAAYLSRAGQAYLQVGDNEGFQLFQAAWSGAAYDPEPGTEPGEEESPHSNPSSTRQAARKKDRISQAQALSRHIPQVAGEHSISRLPGVWLPVLPERLALSALRGSRPGWNGSAWQGEPGGLEPLVGLVDDPAHQAQYPLALTLADVGNVLVLGKAGSGKTTFLRTALVTLALDHSPEGVQLYVLDFGGQGLQPLAGLPHIRAYLLPGEVAQVKRLLAWLSSTLNNRARMLADSKLEKEKIPAIVVVVDGYSSFAAAYPDYIRELNYLIKEGRRSQIYCLISSSAPGEKPASLISSSSQVLCLELNNSEDYQAALGDIKGTRIPKNIPGRGLVRRDRIFEFQTACPEIGKNLKEQEQALASLVKMMSKGWRGKQAPRVQAENEPE